MAMDLSSDVSFFMELLAQSDLAVAIKDADGRYVFVSSNFSALMGHSVQALLGLTDADLFEGPQATALRTSDQAAWQKTGVISHEQRLTCAGVRREFLILRSVHRAAPTALPRHLVCVWKELTESRRTTTQLALALKQLEQQQQALEALHQESQNAPLGAVPGQPHGKLYQRVQFDEQLRREADLSSREHREFSLVAIEVDPPSGDTAGAAKEAIQAPAIEALGRLLRSNTRAMDASCRVDQTRFAVLLSGVGLATAHSRMEGLRRQCSTHLIALGGQSFGFTVSMGVASFPHTAGNEQDLLGAANLALQEARKRGGNHVTLASIRFEAG
jgi:diguanylate cyclase (GGDEF)-like protein